MHFQTFTHALDVRTTPRQNVKKVPEMHSLYELSKIGTNGGWTSDLHGLAFEPFTNCIGRSNRKLL